MGKIIDSIKGFINKKFLQEVVCAHCGKTEKIMFVSTLKDGNRICSSCMCEIPKEFKFEAKQSTIEDFNEICEFMDYNKKELEPIFVKDPSFSYGDFEVDTLHNLCRIDDSFIIEIDNIATCSVQFKPEKIKEGMFSTKAKGNVELTLLILEKPRAIFENVIIKFDVKGKVEKPMFSNTYIYHNPDDFDDFITKFNALYENLRIEKKAKQYVEQGLNIDK